MDPLSTGSTPQSGSDERFYYKSHMSYHGIQSKGNARMYYGNVSIGHPNRDAEESDSDTDSQEDMPALWHAAQSPEHDPFYVSPVNPDSGTRKTTWIKPMLDWAPADVSSRDELIETFRAAIQPEFERMDGENVDGTSPTNPGQDYYADDFREDLGALVSQVEHTRTHMPAYLASYYENFPMIRQRHEATYMSPVGHLPKILKRASKLDKLILG